MHSLREYKTHRPFPRILLHEEFHPLRDNWRNLSKNTDGEHLIYSVVEFCLKQGWQDGGTKWM